MLIVMRRVDERVFGQGKDLGVNRPVKSFGAPILEIRPPAPVDEQCIAGKDARLPAFLEKEAMMSVGVSGGKQRPQRQAAHDQGLLFRDAEIGAGQSFDRGIGDLTAGERPQPARRTDVVGMDVGFEGQFQRQAELAHQREVAFRSLDHRIDERAFPRFLTADQIGVGGGFRLEQLPEDHRPLHPLQACLISRARSATGSARSAPTGSSALSTLDGAALLASIRSRETAASS